MGSQRPRFKRIVGVRRVASTKVRNPGGDCGVAHFHISCCLFVIPAKAGIQFWVGNLTMDSRVRGNDKKQE